MRYPSFVALAAVGLGAVTALPGGSGGSKDDPVCIVGAGPAGLSAAKVLEEKGKSVVVFEKRPEVGGKCQAYYDANGLFHPLGAVIFTKGTYTETLKVVESTGVPYDNFTTYTSWAFNWTTGAVEPSPAITPEIAQALGADFQRYGQLWATSFAPLSGIGYKTGVPPELAVPAAEWFAANGLNYLGLVINDAMVTFGYGDWREVPMLYVAQFFTPDIIASSLRLVQRYIVDFHEVFVRYAGTLKGPVHTGADIKLITRGSAPTILYYPKAAWLPRLQRCSAVVLAFPPTLSALRKAGLTLTKDERSLFAQVGVINYWSSTVRMAQLPAAHSFWVKKPSPFVPPDAAGEPVFFQPLHPGQSNVVNAWSWDKYRAEPDEKKVLRLLVDTLGKLNKDPTNATQVATPISRKDILGFGGWVDYFPHVDPIALVQGWYDKFNKMQGSGKTYYASGLNGFETVEFAIRAGRDMATYL